MNRTLSIGPLNSASQASAWARSLRDRTAHEAFTVAFDGPVASLLRDRRVNDRSDQSLPHYRLAPTWLRKARVRRLIGEATHHLNESNMPLAGDPHTTRFTDEAETYRRLGVSSAVVFHGSDARDPQRSIELNEHSFFTEADPEWTRRLGEQAKRNRAAVASAGLPTFVTTPDMLEHVEGSRLLPITLSLDGWASEDTPLDRPVPRVLHRPSASATATKGTRHIDSALEALERRGRIEIVRSGVVSHDAMPALLHSADIVIDQIQTGAYGVIAIEAMAAGRVVISGVSEHTRRVMGDEVPLRDANPDTLRSVLDDVLDDRDRAREIATNGPEFVRRWHDGTAAATVLNDWLCAHDRHERVSG